VRGFNRVVRGEAWQISRTPPEWRQSTIFGAVDVGYRRLVVPGENQNETLNGGFVTLQLVYGDALLDLTKKPFSFFRTEMTLATNNGSAGSLALLQCAAAWPRRSWGTATSTILPAS
jgi:hypothetical protein